jgi:hypothetical protein
MSNPDAKAEIAWLAANPDFVASPGGNAHKKQENGEHSLQISVE